MESRLPYTAVPGLQRTVLRGNSQCTSTIQVSAWVSLVSLAKKSHMVNPRVNLEGTTKDISRVMLKLSASITHPSLFPFSLGWHCMWGKKKLVSMSPKHWSTLGWPSWWEGDLWVDCKEGQSRKAVSFTCGSPSSAVAPWTDPGTHGRPHNRWGDISSLRGARGLTQHCCQIPLRQCGPPQPVATHWWGPLTLIWSRWR